eukprot:TRINITY_DN15148_c0_g1_i1.p1 TRINITY_DN15148_c0_g1~~TRINITY_DN15148_c0_g1_i1.p1  ORF type:complete len:397 (-),score=79.09 TRINITY_DN15148_c0_g1_i1:63-1121(-)
MGSPRGNHVSMSTSGDGITTNGTLSPSRIPQTPGLAQSRGFFLKALESILRIPAVIPQSNELREKVLFYMHRMVECVGSGLLPYLHTALSILLPTTLTLRIKDIQDYITLINQLMMRYKDAMFAIVNDLFLGLIERIFKVLNTTSTLTPNSEEQREMVELQKHYYLFLQAMLTNSLSHVLTSSTNITTLERVLSTVLQGCNSDDQNLQKVCFVVLRRMVEEWCIPTNNGSNGTPAQNNMSNGNNHVENRGLEGFNKVIYQQIIPLTFSVPLKPNFDFNDSINNTILGEITKIHKSTVTKCGSDFLVFLNQQFFPTLLIPPTIAEQFLAQIEKSPLKQYHDYFKTFKRLKKGS